MWVCVCVTVCDERSKPTMTWGRGETKMERISSSLRPLRTYNLKTLNGRISVLHI